MDHCLRPVFPAYIKHAWIRDKNGIRRLRHIFHLPEICGRFVKIRIVSHDIGGNVHPDTLRVRPDNAFSHFLRRKIPCLCTKREKLSTHIYGIRTISESSIQCVRSAGRKKQFRFSFIYHDKILIWVIS